MTAPEYGWLIESPELSRVFGRAMYWCGGVRWDGDSLQAVRFAREVDARRVIAYLRPPGPGDTRDALVAREHAWG